MIVQSKKIDNENVPDIPLEIQPYVSGYRSLGDGRYRLTLSEEYTRKQLKKREEILFEASIKKGDITPDSLDEEQERAIAEVLKDFKEGEEVKAGYIRTYKDKIYIVKDGKDHTTQSDWTPDKAESLWRKWINPEVIEEWSSYAPHEFADMPVGTKVTDEGKKYQLINPGQGYRKPSGEFGHHGWSGV